MTCEEAKQVLMDLALDEVAPQQRRQVQSHVQDCEACRGRLADLDLTRKLLVEGLPQEEVPRRIAFVTAPAPSLWWRGWLARPAFAVPMGVAAAIVVIVAALAAAQARVSVHQGRWEMAFGAGSAAPARDVQRIPANAGLLTREETARMVATSVAAAVRESEARQRAESAALLRAWAAKGERRHFAAVNSLAQEMRLFERTQNIFYKENAQALQLVASRLPADKGERP